jgi:hypothetical protein
VNDVAVGGGWLGALLGPEGASLLASRAAGPSDGSGAGFLRGRGGGVWWRGAWWLPLVV